MKEEWVSKSGVSGWVIEKLWFEKSTGLGVRMLTELWLCYSLAICLWIYGIPSLSIVVKWRYLNILDYAEAYFSSKTIRRLWVFINTHLYLWVVNSFRDCTPRGLSVFSWPSISWQVFLLFLFLRRLNPIIYPHCSISQEMGGKVHSAESIYLALRHYLLFPLCVVMHTVFAEPRNVS